MWWYLSIQQHRAVLWILYSPTLWRKPIVWELKRMRKLGIKKITKRTKVRPSLFGSDHTAMRVWLLYLSDDTQTEKSTILQQRSTWACYFYKTNKEVYNYAEQEIVIQGSFDSYAGMTWPAVSISSSVIWSKISVFLKHGKSQHHITLHALSFEGRL